MAKQEQKTNLYLLAIVGIVAVVGVVVLVLNAGSGGVYVSDDLSGEAFKSGSTSLKPGITSLKPGMASLGTIIIGSGTDAIVVSATDCGDYCDQCGCDAEGKNCKCND